MYELLMHQLQVELTYLYHSYVMVERTFVCSEEHKRWST